jgi:hypothetical protein
MSDLTGSEIEVGKPIIGSPELQVHDAIAPLYVPARISRPEFVDWHMILDQELSQLSRPEQGVFRSLGFVGLGGALGLLAPFIGVLGKIGATATANAPMPTFSGSDVAYIATFAGSCVLAAVCLTIAGVAWFRNRGLAAEIRKRTKHPT